MNTSHKCWFARFVVLAATFTGFAGCRAPDAKESRFSPLAAIHRHIPWKAEEEPVIPYRIEGNWIDAVQYQQGKIPQRGFGGRIFFYPDSGEKPVPVEGELAIYAFVEDGRNPTDNRPTRKYVYPAEILAEQVRDTELGKSYDIWVPWDEVGGPQTRVSLMCRFQPKLGAAIVSEQSALVLPGPAGTEHTPISETPASPATPHRSAVEQAMYQSPGPAATNAVQSAGYATGAPSGPSRIAPTTIPLPRNFPIRRPVAGESNVIPPAQPASRITIPAQSGIGVPIGAPPQNIAVVPDAVGTAAQGAASAPAGGAARWPTTASGLSQYNVQSRPGAMPTNPVPQSQMPPIQVGGVGNQPMPMIPSQPQNQQPAANQQPTQVQPPIPSNGGWNTFGSGYPTPPPNVPPGVRYTTVNGQLVGP